MSPIPCWLWACSGSVGGDEMARLLSKWFALVAGLLVTAASSLMAQPTPPGTLSEVVIIPVEPPRPDRGVALRLQVRVADFPRGGTLVLRSAQTGEVIGSFAPFGGVAAFGTHDALIPVPDRAVTQNAEGRSQIRLRMEIVAPIGRSPGGSLMQWPTITARTYERRR